MNDLARKYYVTLEAIALQNKHIIDELNANGVHRLENIMTLSRNIHAHFDSLYIWLEADKVRLSYIRFIHY